MKIRCLAALLLISSQYLLAEGEIGFIERFALAADREKVLSELPPGTDDYFFYHALHFQNTRQTDKLNALLSEWRKQFDHSEKRRIIETRESLLGYDANPDQTLAFLKRELNLQFNHRQATRQQNRELPSELDPAQIDRQIYLGLVLSQNALDQLSSAEKERLIRDKAPLKPEQIRVVLSSLQHPDVPNLVEYLAADFNAVDAPAFGSLGIHRELLPGQLNELIKLVPRLADDPNYIHTRLSKLAPSEDEDAEFDPVVREAWLERLWEEVKDLPPAFNYLKVRVLQHRLAHDQKKGLYDQERFLAYLKLPRRTSYISPLWKQKLDEQNTYWADLFDPFGDLAATLPPLGDDQSLVRDYFLQIFAQTAANHADPQSLLSLYTQYVDTAWLRPLLAEAMITLVKDKPDKWTSYLAPAQFQELKDRVDIDFTSTNKPFHKPGDEISVDLFLKNTPQLLVRVYEINTLGYYLQEQRLLNTDLNLDGLVANSETVHNYEDSPFHRIKRSFAFPELKGKRGAWLIEFIGGGRSSRALITTGQWHLVQSVGPVGDKVQILDENHAPVKDAVVWIDGRRIVADAKTGEVVIPFTNVPAQKQLVLASAAGDFASLVPFYHHGENYTLDTQFYLNREQLIAGQEATLAVRTTLLNTDKPLPLALLKNTKLIIKTTTLDGIESTLELPIEKLSSEKDLTQSFSVPSRLNTVNVTLRAEIRQLTQGDDVKQLTASESWTINEADKTETIISGFFSKFADQYVFEVLGKNAELHSNQQVLFSFYRKGFTQPVRLPLVTDDSGRVKLGNLNGVFRVVAETTGMSDSHLTVTNDGWVMEWHEINTTSDERVEISLPRAFTKEAYSLIELRGGTPAGDMTSHIEAGNGTYSLAIKPLPPGDYVLRANEGEEKTTIRVTKGQIVGGWIFGSKRNLELTPNQSLNIANTRVEGDHLLITLSNPNTFTRVHVAGSRFMPANEFMSYLGEFSRFTPASELPSQLPNLYSTGREIGDEYRYILDRRHTKKFAGNMLTRPEILLNPWEVREAGQTAVHQNKGEAAEQTAGARMNESMAPAPKSSSMDRDMVGGYTKQENLDFLMTGAPVLYNLLPDAEGIVRVPLSQLKDRQHLEIYAHDLTDAVQRQVSLAEKVTGLRDLRLAHPLEPATSFAEMKQTTPLDKGGKLIIKDISNSQVETFDSIKELFSFFGTLSKNNPELAKFSWLLQWPTLNEEEKLEKYSEFSCRLNKGLEVVRVTHLLV